LRGVSMVLPEVARVGRRVPVPGCAGRRDAVVCVSGSGGRAPRCVAESARAP